MAGIRLCCGFRNHDVEPPVDITPRRDFPCEICLRQTLVKGVSVAVNWRDNARNPPHPGSTSRQLRNPEDLSMRVLRPFLAVAVAALFSLAGSAEPLAAADLFPDKALLAAVRDGLKKGEKDELKEEDLKNLYFLMGSGKKIADLTGLEKCVNLASIELAKNEIVDLKPLAGLKNVQTLDLASNKIVDVAPLSGLEKLQYLQLEKNQIENLEPLKGLKKLTSLYLSNNKIKTIAPLGGLEKLAALYVDHNEISEISAVKTLKWLERLDVRHNSITDLSPLSGLTELRYTMLQENKVTDLAVLVEMAKKDAAGEKRFAPFWKLYLKANPLTDAAKNAQVAELKSYNVRVDLEK